MVIIREMPQFEHSGRKGAFRNWLRVITVHRLRGYWRTNQTRPDQAADERLDMPAFGTANTMNSFSSGCLS